MAAVEVLSAPSLGGKALADPYNYGIHPMLSRRPLRYSLAPMESTFIIARRSKCPQNFGQEDNVCVAIEHPSSPGEGDDRSIPAEPLSREQLAAPNSNAEVILI